MSLRCLISWVVAPKTEGKWTSGRNYSLSNGATSASCPFPKLMWRLHNDFSSDTFLFILAFWQFYPFFSASFSVFKILISSHFFNFLNQVNVLKNSIAAYKIVKDNREILSAHSPIHGGNTNDLAIAEISHTHSFIGSCDFRVIFFWAWDRPHTDISAFSLERYCPARLQSIFSKKILLIFMSGSSENGY